MWMLAFALSGTVIFTVSASILLILFFVFLVYRGMTRDSEKISPEEAKNIEEENDRRITFFMTFDSFFSSTSQEDVDKKLKFLAEDFFASADKWYQFRQFVKKRKMAEAEEDTILEEIRGKLLISNISFLNLESAENFLIQEIKNKKEMFWKIHNLVRDLGFVVKEKISQYNTQ